MCSLEKGNKAESLNQAVREKQRENRGIVNYEVSQAIAKLIDFLSLVPLLLEIVYFLNIWIL